MNTPRPLNQIFYGPPGTGKTFETMTEAVRICDDGRLPVGDRASLTARFRQLRDQGRIEFVTFHQSYGYEDFIEGIRPVVVSGDADTDAEPTQELQYERHDGVFKRLCDRARARTTAVQHPVSLDHIFWKMSLGARYNPDDDGIFFECQRNNQVRLGYGKGVDFAGCDTLEAVLDKVRETDPDANESTSNVRAVNLFKNQLQIGDLIIVPDGTLKFRAIGKVTGEYEHLANKDAYQQSRAVEWVFAPDQSLSVDMILNKRFSQRAFYPLDKSLLKTDVLADLLSGARPGVLPCYVLIIDEINRGNISKVFGELITLIEPDKRLGAGNELRVTLPYSPDPFGVPINVYLIGTMNTADRSIAFLDTALRRRFRFREMMPQPQVLREHMKDNGLIEGIDVPALLETINRRIEALYDRDHQIGHAYFINVTSLADLFETFRHQIVPLLQEYFHEDWSKVCEVLGCPYDVETAKASAKNVLPLIVVERLESGAANADPPLRYSFNPALSDPTVSISACFRAISNKSEKDAAAI